MQSKNRKYSYKSVQTLPKLGAIQTEWNLVGDYYKGTNDPKIERDIAITERAYQSFAKKYKNGVFVKNASSLLRALTEYEALSSLPSSRPGRYFWFRVTKNASDSEAIKKLSLIDSRLTKASNLVLFFELAIGKIPTKTQRQYLTDAKLAHFKYYLKNVFDDAKHTLSEPEEKILSLKSEVSHGLWVAGTDNILNRRVISYKGKSVPLASSMDMLETLPSAEKPKLWAAITDGLASLAEVAENELNAIVQNKKISDELRHYTAPYEATIRAYENEEKAVLALVDAISTKGFALSKKYYALKAKHKGVASFPYANRNDAIGTDINVPFKEAVEICRDTFYGLDTVYGKIFDDMLTTGKIDVYPKEGKSGGAFCAGSVNVPTYVMLNQVDSQRSMTTLAHEMGHAIHTERSKTQSPMYQGYSTTTAETASTLFEGLVQERFIETLDDSEKLGMLDRKIGESIATICRQVAFFNFERELHETIRLEGAMTWKEMAALLKKHLESYLGKAVEVTEADGLSFVFIGHFRNFFYVYSYAYGELMSNLMSQKLRADSSYIKKIDTFLTSGGNNTVENIFGSIGINARTTETFLESLRTLEADIATFGKLIKK